MNCITMKILFFVSICLVLFTIDQVISQWCHPPCRGGPNDICSSCASYCVKTCEQPNGPEACIQLCRENECKCAAGYVRAPNGRCIRSWRCPANKTIHVSPIRCNRRCYGGLHDGCAPCGTKCPATCDNPNPGACTKDCAIDVCRCAPGYVRARNGQCIRPWQCPRPQCIDQPNFE